MERTGRLRHIHTPNTIHHVMMRGNNRQRIFFGADYFNRFLEIIDESTKKFDHKILAYCLMTNHIHLIVHIKESPLPTVMQNINFRYARWTNKKLQYIGHLFQARYRSLPVKNEEYLINLCRYIHYNPVVAKIVETPEYYLWSSHKNYISNDAPEWLDFKTITQIIINKTRLCYFDFIAQDVDRKKWKPALYLLESGELVIDDVLMKNAIDAKHKPKINQKYLSIECISSLISEKLTINQSELYGLSRNRDVSKKRALLISYLLKYSDKKLSEIAHLFNRTQSTLQRQVLSLMHSKNKYFSNDLLQKIDAEIKKIN